jgi:hypothetical protein
MNKKYNNKAEHVDKTNDLLSLRNFETAINFYGDKNGNEQKKGEITGDSFSEDDFRFGMGIRSHFSAKSENDEKRYDEDNDIFKEENNFLIENNDSSSNKYLDISDFDKKMNGFQYSYINKINNNYNIFLLKNIITLSKTQTCFSPFSTISILASLFIASKNYTEQDIQKYLGFSTKSNTLKSIVEIKNILDKSKCISLNSLILISNEYQINRKFVEYIKDLVLFLIINKNNKEEYTKINNFLNDYGIVGKTFKKNHIDNLSLTCLSCGFMKTIWQYPFDKVIMKSFNGKGTQMLFCNNRVCKYLEDQYFQYYEEILADNITSFGIILPKNDFLPKNIPVSSNMKDVILSQVIIPKFTFQLKLRLINLIKMSGLDSLLYKMDISDLIDENIKLSDFTQNITIIIDEANINNHKPNYSILNVKFITDKPFIYYFRLMPSNTIILTGYFC